MLICYSSVALCVTLVAYLISMKKLIKNCCKTLSNSKVRITVVCSYLSFFQSFYLSLPYCTETHLFGHRKLHERTYSTIFTVVLLFVQVNSKRNSKHARTYLDIQPFYRKARWASASTLRVILNTVRTVKYVSAANTART